MADVGPIRREETTGYYRLFAHDEDKENKEQGNDKHEEDRRPRLRHRKGTKEFSRGDSEDSDEQGLVPKDERIRINATGEIRTSDNQKWIIT